VKYLTGTYHYKLAGNPASVIETFQLTKEKEKSRVTTKRVIGSGKEPTILECLSEFSACLSSGKASFSMKNGKKHCTADFKWNRNTIQTQRQRSTTRESKTYTNLDDFIFFPLMRVFQGRLIMNIRNKSTEIYTPHLNSIDDSNLFSLRRSTRISSRLDKNNTFSTIGYKVNGGPYSKEDTFWVNEELELLTYYKTQQQGEPWSAYLEIAGK